MAIVIEYSQEKELDDWLEKLLNTYPLFAPLTSNGIKISACFVIRTDDNEATVAGKGEPVIVKRVPAAMQIFMKPKASFVVVVDYYFWENATDKVKNSQLFRALSRIRVEKTDNGLKLGMRQWDIQDNIATVVAFGPYTDKHVMYAEAIRGKQLSMSQAGIDRTTPKAPKAPKASEPLPEPEVSEPDPEETVAARPANKVKAVANNNNDDDEPRRPARRIPPEPVSTTAEPEPEPEPEPED